VRDNSAVKATGLPGDALPEVIEIIDDDADAFGERGRAATTADSGGPRWIVPTAVALLVALITYGVATSATKGLPKVAAPPTTTSAPTTTQPKIAKTTVTTTDDAPIVPYYSADPPRQFAVQSAELLVPDTRRLREDNYQLWETIDGASATQGSWFSIETFPTGPDSQYTVDAYRAGSSDRPLTISHLATGQSIAEFAADKSVQVRLTALGWSDEDLIRLARSITVDDNDVQVADPSLTAGYAPITAVPPWLAVEGRPAEKIDYSSNTDPDGGFSIVVAERPPIAGGVKSRERQIALRFLLDQPTSFDVDGYSGIAGDVVGNVVGKEHEAVATWVADDHIVSLFADMPVPDLIAIAQTVRPVTVDVWRGMQFQAAVRGVGNHTNDGTGALSGPLPVSAGTDNDAHPWQISVGVANSSGHKQIIWHWDASSIAAPATTQPQIKTVADSQRTYVLAQLPRDAAPAAQLQINRSGLDPVTVPFNDTDPEVDRAFAAYAFSDLAPYTAQIVGADGTVLASWPQ